MANRIRNINLGIRVSDTEREMIQERMDFAGISSLTEYMIRMAIDGCILVVDDKELRDLRLSVGGIGRNINQIAHRINSLENVTKDDLSELMNEVENLWQLLRSKQSM